MVGYFFKGTAHFRSIVIAIGRPPRRREGQAVLPADDLWCPPADPAADLPPARRRRRVNGADA